MPYLGSAPRTPGPSLTRAIHNLHFTTHRRLLEDMQTVKNVTSTTVYPSRLLSLLSITLSFLRPRLPLYPLQSVLYKPDMRPQRPLQLVHSRLGLFVVVD
jgi:hypothetical protein